MSFILIDRILVIRKLCGDKYGANGDEAVPLHLYLNLFYRSVCTENGLNLEESGGVPISLPYDTLITLVSIGVVVLSFGFSFTWTEVLVHIVCTHWYKAFIDHSYNWRIHAKDGVTPN